jgi:uncharacterized protein YecT (DUF1311 family)
MNYIILFLLSLSSIPLYSQVDKQIIDPIDQKMNDCMLKYNTNIGDRDCQIQAEKDWDSIINKYYKLILDTLPSVAKKEFIKDQKSWVDYKNKEFQFLDKFYHKVKQAEWLQLGYYNSRMVFVRKRAVDLQNYYYVLKI